MRGTSNASRRMAAFLNERVAPLEPPIKEGFERMAALPAASLADAVAGGGWTTSLRSGFRKSLVTSYRSRAGHAPAAPPVHALMSPHFAPSPVFPSPGLNWMPIGPSAMRRGQAGNRPAVSGRVDGMALAAGGRRVYAATANGGVWRSDDGGATWRPTMDALESNPGKQPADSLACGAIAIDPANPDRVFVGTGEPFGALDSYFGVGPLFSSDGGANWNREHTDPNSPSLDGTGFFRLAVDSIKSDRVVAATKNGLYRREPKGQEFVWVRKRGGVATSVVSATVGAVTTFFAALTPGGVFTSTDGDQWDSAGNGFPASTGVVVLAVRPGNPFPVYALLVDPHTHHLMDVLRLDAADGPWLPVAGAPPELFGDLSHPGQGWYDASIAVAPDDESLLFLGGGANPQFEGAGFYRCRVSAAGQPPDLTYSMQSEWIGTTVHADIHALEFTPGNPAELWVGCDGGVFMTGAAPTSRTFVARNTGLATVSMNHLGLHPSEDGILFCGVQDNGTVRYTSSEVWLHSAAGDGGYVAIHPKEPHRVLRTYISNILEVTNDGGQDYSSWVPASVPIPTDDAGNLTEAVEFYAPLACSPDGLAAFGGQRPWISDFGTNWRPLEDGNPDTDLLPAAITSLYFPNESTLFAGCKDGGIYRYDSAQGSWTRRQISRSPLLRGAVTGIAADSSDASGNSIYICFGGGPNDYRHVWHYDGANWEPRSGPGPSMPASLLAVQHNAIVTDPANPSDIYAAADLGVWRSSDGGRNWRKFAQGLPEAAVIDLKLHPGRRMLWAATHGRGVFERPLDTDTAPVAELWSRDTVLDTGRRATTDGLPDPTNPTRTVTHTNSPDIKLDTPAADGSYQTGSPSIDCLEFEDVLQDRSANLPAAADGADPLLRVFVQVHNRSRQPADVRVMLLLGPADAVHDLPANYDANVQNGTAIATASWNTVGVVEAKGVAAGHPGIVEFDLRGSVLRAHGAAPGAQLTLLALLHSDADPFVSAVLNVDSLVLAERKAVEKRLAFV